MSEAASTQGKITHLQAVRKFSKIGYPISKKCIITERCAETIQQRKHLVDFLPYAVLGEANDFIIVKSSLATYQEKWQVLDGLLQRIPMKLRERELLPLGWY
jgi:hypothetical protein